MFTFISQRAQVVRSYYSGIGKTPVICVAAFLVAFAIAQASLGIILYAKKVFAAEGTVIGILAGCWQITYSLGCLFVRPLFRRILPRYLIVASCLLMAACILGVLWAPSLVAICVIYGFFGLALSQFWPPIMGWVSEGAEGTELGRQVSRFNLSWCTGVIVGPFVCGWLSESSPEYPLLLGAAIPALTAVFVMGATMALPRVREDRGVGATQQAPSEGAGQSTFFRYPAWVGLFASFFGFGVLVAVFPMAAIDELGWVESRIGLILAARGLSNAAGFIFLGRTRFWHFKATPMLAGQVLAVVAFVALAGSGSLARVGMLMLLLGATTAMSYSSSIFHGASCSPDRRKRMAIHEAVLAMGLMTGSVIGGFVYEHANAAAVYGLVALLLGVATVIQAVMCVKGRSGG